MGETKSAAVFRASIEDIADAALQNKGYRAPAVGDLGGFGSVFVPRDNRRTLSAFIRIIIGDEHGYNVNIVVDVGFR
jgi:hypothetical protein